MITGWIDVRNKLPDKSGVYICCVKNSWAGQDLYDVQTLHFAKNLLNTNTCFSEFKDHDNFRDVYNHPGFYFMCGGLWEAEEIPYAGSDYDNDELLVTHWMEFPDSPFKKT